MGITDLIIVITYMQPLYRCELLFEAALRLPRLGDRVQRHCLLLLQRAELNAETTYALEQKGRVPVGVGWK